MNKYQLMKEKVREDAINWQCNFQYYNYSWEELAEFYNHFYKLGKRYGLLKEFKENGIC